MIRFQNSLVAVAVAFLCLGEMHPAGAAEFPSGTFTLKDAGGTMWALRFDGKDKITVSRAGKEVVEGTYKVIKDEIEFTDEKGPFAGAGEAKTGTYKWKRDGDKLTFTKVKDQNRGRATVLTADAWEKEKE